MRTRSVNKILNYVQSCIQECWEAQAPLDDDDPDYKAVAEQICAYQDVHKFISGDEFDGELTEAEDDGQVEDEAEPEPEVEPVLEEDEDSDDSEDE